MPPPTSSGACRRPVRPEADAERADQREPLAGRELGQPLGAGADRLEQEAELDAVRLAARARA